MHIDAFRDLRDKIRDLAGWLSGSGLLIFDDEPLKAYEASVYSPVGVEQLLLQPKATIDIEFECQPFAVSTDTNRIVDQGRTSKEITITNKGNVNTCGVLTIKNTGTIPIKKIRITRKVVV